MARRYHSVFSTIGMPALLCLRHVASHFGSAGEQTAIIEDVHTKKISDLQFSSDMALFVTASIDGFVTSARLNIQLPRVGCRLGKGRAG